MRKFTIPARRFSAIALPFSSPFVRVHADTPERANTIPITSGHHADDGNQSLSNHGHAAATIRLSRTYW